MTLSQPPGSFVSQKSIKTTGSTGGLDLANDFLLQKRFCLQV